MRVKSTIFLIAILCCIGSEGTLFAGTTGKIAGVIKDAEKGEPLVGVNIVIKGTNFGAASDIMGNYTIMNMPPGEYTIVVSSVGYQRLQFQAVRVSADLTTTLDVELQTAPVTMEMRVIVAERPLVRKDNTGSLSTVDADQIKSLPVQTISDLLRIEAGVIEAAGSLHIRGGRSGEISYWVDGISTTDVYDGSNGVRVENSAVQELQVISGTFNAEYGQAMSGIVNTVTKDGGEQYKGEVKVYSGDYVSNDSKFSMFKNLTTGSDPSTGLTKIVNSETVYPLKKFNPIYNGEMSLSGPFPFISSDLRFFANGRYFYDEGYYYGVNWFQPDGAPGDHSVVAMNPNKTTSLQGKLSYRLSNALRLTYGAFWNQSKRDRNYFGGGITSHDYKYDPYGLPQNKTEGLTQIVTMNHVLSPSTFYEVRAGRYYSQTKQYVYANPTQGIKYLVQVTADSTKTPPIPAEVFDASTPEGKAHLQAIIGQGGTYNYIADPNGPQGYIDPQTLGQPTSYSFVSKGMDPNNFERSTAYWIGKFDLTSQLDRANELKVGAEARLHELTLHSYQVVGQKDELGNVIAPFQPTIPEVGSTNRTDYDRKPREISAYVQDKLEYKEIILNIGLRFDYFDANSMVPADPTDPNIYFPFKNAHIYKGWVDPPNDYYSSTDQWRDSLLSNNIMREYTPDERRQFMQKSVDAKMALSPRLGFSFPITDRGIIHFSYGHFFQIPQFQYLYADPDFKINNSTGNVVMGNADLEPQKTVSYEIGLQQQLSEEISVDATLFYRDVRGWVGTSPLIKTEYSAGRTTGSDYSIYENKDYENVKGVTLRIEKRFMNNFSINANYTFQSAEGTYSNPTDAYNAITNNQAPVLALLPLNWDQKHTVNLQGILRVSDWMVSLIARYWTGLPYTPSFIPEAVGASAVTGYTTNSARLPDQKSVDLTISKTFRLAPSYELQFFVNVYNLLDQRDPTSVYTDTGSPDYTAAINPSSVLYSPLRVSTIEDFVNQPSWYSAPRQIQVGMSLGF